MKAIKENLIEFQSYFEQQHNDFYADMAKEALAELQDLESYIEGQIAKYTKEGLAYRDSDNLQKGLQMIEKAGAYTDILQKIRGEG